MSKEAKPTHYLVAITVLLAISLFSFTNVYFAPTETNQTSFWKTIYCNTIGDWFNSSRCPLREDIDIMEYNTVTLVDDEPNTQINNTDTNKTQSNHPSTSQLTVNRDSATTLSSNPTNTQTPIFDLSILNDYVTKDHLSSHNSNTNSTNLADYVTRDFLSRQVGAIGDSFGRSLSDLSTTLTALIPSTTSISNWDSFFTTPSTRILAGTNLSWDGNTLNATGGSNAGESLILSNNIFGQSSLTPTTTQNLAISGIGTSTFAGGLESWRQISSPYFQATSTTATSTFAGGLSVASSTFNISNYTGNVGIGTISPIAKLNVVGSTILKGNTYLNTGGGRQFLRDFDATLSTSNSSSTIVFIGDSWTHGQGYTVPIKSYLQKQYGDAGPGYASANTAMPTIAGITRSKQGTWSTGSYTYGPSLSYAVSTGVGTTTFSGNATDIVFQYMNIPNGDDLTYSVDGTGTTTISTANAVTSTQSVKISGLSVSAVHRLDIVSSGTGSAGVNLLGADFQVNTRSGVHVNNIAYTGSTVQTWLNINATYWQDSLTILRPNLVVIMLGVNDAFSVTPNTYKANLQALIARVKIAVPRSSIMLFSPGDISGATLAPMEEYVDAMSEVAAIEQVAFVNNYALIGDYATANARGLYENTTHVSTAGYDLLAKNFITFIQQSRPISINSVANQSGTDSISLGVHSLTNNIGTSNTAFGNTSLLYNTSGNYNSALGYASLYFNTTGSYNSALGYASLYSNSTGASNVAQGMNSLYANTTGSQNTAQGYDSLHFNTTGSYNSAQGHTSLYSNTTGSYNSSQGLSSLYSNTTGSYNTVQGNVSFYANTTGSNNTGVGYRILRYNQSATNTTAVGYQAGLGTANYSSQGGTYLGYQAGYSAGTGGDYNTMLGYQSGYNVSTGKYNIIIGQNVNATSSDSVGGLNIGNVLFGTGMYTGSSVSATALTTGRIGVATTTPWRTLAVTGTVGFDGLTAATGAGSICLSATKELVYNAGSDACLPSLRSTKHDISNLSTSSLSTLNLLTPVSFIYNQGDNRTRYGFIAEDVSQIDTHLATYNDKGEISGIDDRALIALAIGSIKELDAKLRNIITSVGEWVFNKITATLGVFERIESDSVKSNSVETKGIQMTDKLTGQVYCIILSGGNLDKSIGPCSTATSTPAVTPSPEPTATPSVTPVPDLPTPTPTPIEIIDDNSTTTVTVINTTPTPTPTATSTTVVESENNVPTPTPSVTPVPDLPTPTPEATPVPVETVSPEPENTTIQSEGETNSVEVLPNPVTKPVTTIPSSESVPTP